MTAYNNTATTLAPYNNELSINAEETANIISIDRKRRKAEQKRKNAILNRFVGIATIMTSLTLYTITEIMGGIDNEAILFITILGAWIALQREKIFY